MIKTAFQKKKSDQIERNYKKKKAPIIDFSGQKKSRLNRFGFSQFNLIDLQNNRKLAYLAPHITSNRFKKYVLFDKKKYPLKNIQRINKIVKFYLKSNYYDIEERDKIETNLFYIQSFYLKDEYTSDVINNQIKESFLSKIDKTKKKNKNLLKPFFTNFFNFKKKTVVAYSNLKDFKKLLNYNKFLKKKTFFLLKKINLVKKFFNQQKFQPQKIFYLFNNLKLNNYRSYSNINLKNYDFSKKRDKTLTFKALKIELKKVIPIIYDYFAKLCLKNPDQNYFRFLNLPQFREFSHNIKIRSSNVQFYRYFLINYLADFKFQRINLKNFKHLTEIFKFTKSTAKFSGLLFESKPNLVVYNKNYLRKIKNMQLKLLKKRFPDNIFDIMQTKKKKTRKKLILVKEGFRNSNDSIAFFNSKKKKSKPILIQKKNLFTFSQKGFFSFKKVFKKNIFQLRASLKNVRQEKQLKHMFLVSSPIFLGRIFYKRSKKKRRYQKKSVNRKSLNLLNRLFFKKIKIKNKIRRQNLAVELSSFKLMKTLRQDFEGKRKFFITKRKI